MKKLFYRIVGTFLLFPLAMSNTLGITISDFRDEVFRPDNLPVGREGDGSVETKLIDAFNFAINLILYASGSIAVLMFVIGGVLYITSLGKQEQMDNAKKTLKFALIGLLVVIFAYAIVTNIIDLIYRTT
ncbi:hypothetical protein COY07_02420, partial [Candidatus Peregrinibacteria bacterium CG_4_10_14_0_2_um_filter_43_11]